MANGNVNSDGTVNGNEAGEFVVSSIRAGMKREFAMMMKAQAECGIIMGRRRVTRSQNSSTLNKCEGKNGNFGRNSHENLKGTKGFGMKKKRKGDKNENVATDAGKTVEVTDFEMIENDGEKAEAVAAEEEETKSDIVDGNSDDEKRKNLPPDGLEEVTVRMEKEGGDVGLMADEESEKDDLAREPKDGILECMDGYLVVSKEEQNVKMDAEALGIESGLGDTEKVAASNLGTPVGLDNRVPEKTYFRRFTRSSLKPKVEVTEEPKAEETEEEPKAEETEEKSRVEETEEQSRVEEVLELSTTEGVKDEDEEVVENNSIISTPISSKLEMKMSKKVELSKIPAKLKDLLETGLLEGLSVRYVRGSKAIKPGETGLHGIIQGSGILCSCDDCKGIEVVTPNQFELHAGSGNKRPPEYIYLENGKTLRDVLNVCRGASSDSLELAIQNAIGRAVAKPVFCMDCKGQANLNETIVCDSCVAVRESQQQSIQSSDINARTLLPVSSTKSNGKLSSNHRKHPSQGKLTRKDLRLHKLVFQTGFLRDGTPLAYYAQGKQLATGYKSGSGIFCHCCNLVVSPSLFEAHAGCASRRKPYLQIFTADGVSLHEWCLAIKIMTDSSTDQNDDVCSICEAMGELLCCDMCPRAFHKECVNLESVPEGSWFCRYCLNMLQKKKHKELSANAVAAGRVAGIDPFEEVKKRCVRVIGAVEPEVGGCVLCRGHDFNKEAFGPRTVILCDQCEKEYHVGCLKEHGMDDLKELPNEKWFCCSECRSIHSALQQLVDDGEKMLPDHLLSIIKKKHEDNGSEFNSNLNISWRLFHGKMASQETRKWLSGAVSVFHDRFDPIGDSDRGHQDLIPFMIYGRSNRDQDFGGMYSAILIVNSIVVSAGIFRVFGQEVAEIPLVATSNELQGQGYFQALFSCIMNFLESMNVRDLVLPSAHEAESIWMNKFGFEKISAEQLKQYRRDYQLMIFQGTSILHKTVARPELSPT